MKKYFILFLIISLLNNCAFVKKNEDTIIVWSVITVLASPYPIYVATVGVPGVTIGEAIAIGYASVWGGAIALIMIAALLGEVITCMEKIEKCINKSSKK